MCCDHAKETVYTKEKIKSIKDPGNDVMQNRYEENYITEIGLEGRYPRRGGKTLHTAFVGCFLAKLVTPAPNGFDIEIMHQGLHCL